jgi:hypothetical protein
VVRALQQSAAVDEGALHDLVGEHIIDTVFDLLRWPEGDFAFVIDEPNPDDVGVSRVAEDVVSEARRRLEVWGTVAAAIPSADTMLALTPNPTDEPTLSREEWALLALVDGRRSVAQVVALAGRGEFAVVSTLADLVSRGLLRADDADDVAALVRRHELLARLESAPAIETEPAALAPVESDDEDEDDDEPAVAEVTKLPAPSRIGAPPARRAVPAQDRTEVTPKRPEPFLPKRQPEHPEPMPAVAAVAGGAASPSPATAAYIERDPSVNKSLLLRLIAGVRGL